MRLTKGVTEMMTNKQIVEKAITVALAKGYNPIEDMGEVDSFEVYRADGDWIGIWVVFRTKDGDGGQVDIMRMLFEHQFEKSFPKTFFGKDWRIYLKEMIVLSEPLEFIAGYLK
jgi:hypothetical protein